MNVLFLCTGGFSRSRIAAELLRNMNIPGIVVKNAGISDWGAGRDDDHYVAQVIWEITGKMPSNHTSHLVTDKEIDDADLIVVMESWHDSHIRINYPRVIHKVILLSELGNETVSLQNPSHLDVRELRKSVMQIRSYLEAGKGWLEERARRCEVGEKYQRIVP